MWIGKTGKPEKRKELDIMAVTFGMIDRSKIRLGIPEFDPTVRCKDHPTSPVHENYGLAGGGFGPYTVCDSCCKVLSKSEDLTA